MTHDAVFTGLVLGVHPSVYGWVDGGWAEEEDSGGVYMEFLIWAGLPFKPPWAPQGFVCEGHVSAYTNRLSGPDEI